MARQLPSRASVAHLVRVLFSEGFAHHSRVEATLSPFTHVDVVFMRLTHSLLCSRASPALRFSVILLDVVSLPLSCSYLCLNLCTQGSLSGHLSFATSPYFLHTLPASLWPCMRLLTLTPGPLHSRSLFQESPRSLLFNIRISTPGSPPQSPSLSLCLQGPFPTLHTLSPLIFMLGNTENTLFCLVLLSVCLPHFSRMSSL